MKILHVNTLDRKGGAAKVASVLVQNQNSIGNISNLAVGAKLSDNLDSFTINGHNSLSYCSRKFIGKDILYAINCRLRIFIANDINYFNNHRLFSSKKFKEADIIHCHNLHGNYFNLSSLEKISKLKPVIWTLHDMWAVTGHCAHSFECQKYQAGCNHCPHLDVYQKIAWDNSFYLWKKKKDIYTKAKLEIVVPSLWLKNIVEKSILNQQPVNLIYNGIDTNLFKPQDKIQTRKELGLPLDKKIILFLADGGKNNPWKGWEYAEKIAESFINDKDTIFLCVGGNNNKLNNIDFTGYIADPKKIAQYYAAADVFLFPSLAENFPLVVLEAMSCGLPVLAFKVGGVPEAVNHKENGYIAEYKNQEDLTNGLRWLLKLNPEEIKTISLNCSTRVRDNFSLDLMAKNYFNLYQKVLNSKK
jgi:glycosyltransferase involved in cell wall biosynthesis